MDVGRSYLVGHSSPPPPIASLLVDSEFRHSGETLPLFVDVLSLIDKFAFLSSLLRIDAEAIVCERNSNFDYQRRVGATLEEPGTVRALATSPFTSVGTSKMTSGSRTSALSLGSRRKPRIQIGFPTSHALPCLYVLIVIGPSRRINAGKGMDNA